MTNNRNYFALRNANVDWLTKSLVQVATHEQRTALLRVLDRLLRQAHIVIPLPYVTHDIILRSRKLGTPPFPENSPYSPHWESFWVQPDNSGASGRKS
jgi:ABC-type oligopeptide transport system substrate-binding subunit